MDAAKNNNGKKKVITFIGLVCIIAVIVLAPIAVNSFLLKPATRPVVGTNVDWLVFWGSYLSSLISALIAFIILLVQRRDNRTENKSNRQLQLNVLRYQQEMQWLSEKREIMTDFLLAVNVNDLRDIQNQMANSKDMLPVIKTLMDRLILNDSRIGIMHKDKESESFKEYDEVYKSVYDKYATSLDSLQTLCILFLRTSPNDRLLLLNEYRKQDKLKTQLEPIIALYGSDANFLSQPIFDLAMPIVEFTSDLLVDMRKATLKYISAEEERIASFLSDSIKR